LTLGAIAVDGLDLGELLLDASSFEAAGFLFDKFMIFLSRLSIANVCAVVILSTLLM